MKDDRKFFFLVGVLMFLVCLTIGVVIYSAQRNDDATQTYTYCITFEETRQ